MNLASTLRRAALALPLAAVALHAQAAPPSASAIWLTYSGEHAVTRHLLALADVQVRRDGDFGEWRQLLLRGGAAWAPAARVRLGAGYAYMRSYPSDGIDIPEAYPEHRLWQMIQLSQALGPVSLTHRARLEERWINDVLAAAPRAWSYSTRGRYQLRASMPLPGAGDRLSLAASEEIFASVVGRSAAADQNRLTVGVGTRLTPALRVELGYLNRAAIDDGRLTTRDHALLVAFTSSAPLRPAR